MRRILLAAVCAGSGCRCDRSGDQRVDAKATDFPPGGWRAAVVADPDRLERLTADAGWLAYMNGDLPGALVAFRQAAGNAGVEQQIGLARVLLDLGHDELILHRALRHAMTRLLEARIHVADAAMVRAFRARLLLGSGQADEALKMLGDGPAPADAVVAAFHRVVREVAPHVADPVKMASILDGLAGAGGDVGRIASGLRAELLQAAPPTGAQACACPTGQSDAQARAMLLACARSGQWEGVLECAQRIDWGRPDWTARVPVKDDFADAPYYDPALPLALAQAHLGIARARVCPKVADRRFALLCAMTLGPESRAAMDRLASAPPADPWLVLVLGDLDTEEQLRQHVAALMVGGYRSSDGPCAEADVHSELTRLAEGEQEYGVALRGDRGHAGKDALLALDAALTYLRGRSWPLVGSCSRQGNYQSAAVLLRRLRSTSPLEPSATMSPEYLARFVETEVLVGNDLQTAHEAAKNLGEWWAPWKATADAISLWDLARRGPPEAGKPF